VVDVRLYFEGEQIGPRFHRGTVRQRTAVLSAVRLASKRVEEETLKQGRANIAGAGNFGNRWTQGLHVTITEGGGHVRIETTHDVPYFMVHQRGAIIRGKPLLFIPFSFATDAQGVSARDYPGSLFRVQRKSDGLIMLLSAGDGEPKYFGKTQVKIPKRFRVVEIATAVARKFSDYYAAALKAVGSDKE
jgi:hypothetical protein